MLRNGYESQQKASAHNSFNQIPSQAKQTEPLVTRESKTSTRKLFHHTSKQCDMQPFHAKHAIVRNIGNLQQLPPQRAFYLFASTDCGPKFPDSNGWNLCKNESFLHLRKKRPSQRRTEVDVVKQSMFRIH